MSSFGLCTYKDEVTELKDELNKAENQRNPAKYKQLIQQVILYMTKGIDMTPLFTTIVKSAATKDLVQKKLCYLYLCHYASSHADLALLTVNTLKRDAEDTNYMVRGLAIRSMGSLRLASLVEYTKDAILKRVSDHSPYVRKAAIIGCLQLYKLAPSEFKVDDVVKLLNERLTKDKDIQVRRNCLYVLEEMLIHEKSSSSLHHFLLKRLQRFDEWALQFLLDILMRCRPKKDEDIYSTLNSLDVCLKHANTSVVLGAIRVFLHYSSVLAELREDVFNRIKVPLLTALMSKSPEIAYSVACHIEMIFLQSPGLFQDSVSSFYCRYNDPVYLKIKKLDLLSKLITDSNGKQILDELSYHAQHSETTSHSIHNIGKIALLHPIHADMCIEILISFLELRDDSIVSHSLAALRDLVLKYDKHSDLVPNISKFLKLDLLPDGRASVFWMLGEFGESIPDAPYVIEALIDDIEKEISPEVKLELLTATMKLFFKRPPECQAMLGHLLEHCIEQEYNMDIRDRALLYYRLLEVDVNKAKDVICCPRSAQFIDNTNIVRIDSKELLMKEFNTLSVVYGQLSSAFTEQENLGGRKNKRDSVKSKGRENVSNPRENESKKDSKSDKVLAVAVDTSLVEIDEDMTQEANNTNSSLELLDPLDENVSTLEDNVSSIKDTSNQSFDFVSKEKSLLPVDDNLTARKSAIDELETNEDSPSDVHAVKDSTSDGGNSVRECETPISESSVEIQEDRRISLDGSLGKRDDEGEDGTSENRDVSSLLELVEEPDLSPEIFETLWGELPEAESYEIQLDQLPDQENLLKSLTNHRIYTMASSPPDAEQIRYFLYAQCDCYIICEVCLDSTTLDMRCVIKMEDPTNVHSFIEVLQNCLHLGSVETTSS
ncbi:AP-4 complex subunit beta-1-like [Dendronephthya gigantea]|uniref:AP-4 complex subunit beta-1-like n=1 Tax=Dendronephthya gigantea TaxID=151771 RepID=UPI00106AB681|nr:AP-4 complex subunit beta-1-like [Dendronephthya gigantea]